MNNRRAQVQAKRKRLGLDVNGKIAPFTYSTSNWFRAIDAIQQELRTETRLYKPNRKQCYEAALQADRIFQRFHMYEVDQSERVRVMKNWIRWQMRVNYEQQ